MVDVNETEPPEDGPESQSSIWEDMRDDALLGHTQPEEVSDEPEVQEAPKVAEEPPQPNQE